MPITPLPPVPLRSDAAEVFVEKADTFMAALPTFATEANALEGTLQIVATTGTSVTSLLIGTGSKSLTTQTGKAWVVGSWVYIVNTANVANYMTGQITTYTSGTGALVVNVTQTAGSGTLAAWTIGLAVPSTTAVSAVTATTATNIAGGSSGTIPYQTGVGATSQTAAGTTAQFLRGGATPAFVAPFIAGGTAGDIPYQTAANTTALVTPGTTAQVLRGGATPAFVAPFIAGGTTGAIPYQTAPNTTGLSAVGAAGQLFQSTGGGAPTWVTSPWSTDVAAVTSVTVALLPTECTGEDHYACVNISTSDNRLIGWGRSGGWGNPSTDIDGESSAAGWAFYPPIPDGVSIVGHTAASGMSTFVWLSNGWAYSGGYNSQGQLGHGDTTNRLWLKRVEYFVTNSISIAEVVCTGSRNINTDIYAMWRTSAGHVYYSGMSAAGSAGDSGSTAARVVSTPTRCGTITGITGIATSSFSCFAWSASATYSWGFNDYGELGIGNNVNTSTVQTITGLVVSKVATYVNTNQTPTRVGHTLFLLTDGTVKATGNNNNGCLGDGTTTARNAPVVTTGLTSVVDVGCAGADFGYSWAITSGGNLYVWGANNCGQVGIGSTAAQITATTPVGYVTKSGGVVTTGSPPFQGTVVQVQAGKMNSAAYASGCVYVLDSSGKVWVSGNDATMTYDTATVSNLTRFSECSIAKLPTGEKIVKLRHHGHHDSSTTRVFALTNRGRLLVAGNNTYGCALGGDTPGSEQLWVKTFTPVDIRGMNL